MNKAYFYQSNLWKHKSISGKQTIKHWCFIRFACELIPHLIICFLITFTLFHPLHLSFYCAISCKLAGGVITYGSPEVHHLLHMPRFNAVPNWITFCFEWQALLVDLCLVFCTKIYAKQYSIALSKPVIQFVFTGTKWLQVEFIIL